jgi:hypothetical protein
MNSQLQRYFNAELYPIPVPYKTKEPVVKGWPDLRITVDTANQYFIEPYNIGVLLGVPPVYPVDIDLDCPEALIVAPYFLPGTRKFGRASKPESHWVYSGSEGIKTSQYRDPQDGAMLVELRATGGQTIFPGSVHESGERIEFANDLP